MEIIVLMLGAITLGITIHFFISSRRSFRETAYGESNKLGKELENWKLKFFNETEARDKELEGIRQKLVEITEDNNINAIEAEEMRKENKKLLAEMEILKSNPSPPVQTILPEPGEKPHYIEQLRMAQHSLLEHNEKINKLLGQIDIIKETEEKQQEVMKYNEELTHQIDELNERLVQKEKEINNVQQKAQLTKEMTSMLDNAYSEFNVLQDKIHKLENQVTASKKISLEYEDLKEGYYKVTKEFDEQKLKLNAMSLENQELHRILTETQEKLRDSNFQKQQIQKRVIYLEELNNDLQSVADTNKKLESQLKRIGELESMLNVVAEERDDLIKKQFKGL